MPYVEFYDEVSGEIPARGLHAGAGPGKHLVRYAAPPDADGAMAIGYLKPSGKIWFTHPITNEVWYESDQKWVYDYEEAARLEKEEPDRFVRAKG